MRNLIETSQPQLPLEPLEPRPSPESQATFLSLEAVKNFYPQVLDEARALMETCGLAKTEAGKTCLWFCFAQAKILRSLLQEPTSLLNSGFCQKIGGPERNPYRQIDLIGGDLVMEVVSQMGLEAEVFIEERGWVRVNNEATKIVVVDPLDGTSGVFTGLRDQAAGIVIGGKEGNFQAGAIVSLVDREMVLIEEDRVNFLSFEENLGQIKKLSIPPKKEIEFSQARIATLARRMKETMLETPLFKSRFFPDLPTFGGYGVLCLLRGQVDVLIDPFVGQPWYEVFLWGQMAEKMGFTVTDEKGERINFNNIFARAKKGLEERLKIIISANSNLHQQVLEGLKLKIQEGEIFSG